MAFRLDGYYYDQQLKRYLTQFMAIFTDLQVQIGKWNQEDERLISVPIHYGHQDRVVASILADNTQNKLLRLPIMSAYMSGLEMATDRWHGVGTQRRVTYAPTGGLVPDDMKTVHQRMPIQYYMDVQLSIYASNTDQHFQILEQILPLFDPTLQIQTSDSLLDWTKITTVELTNTQLNTNYPIGVDSRIIQSTLTFRVPIYIDTPADVRRDFVEKVLMRIGIVSEVAETNYEILDELNAQGLQYETVATDENLPFE